MRGAPRDASGSPSEAPAGRVRHAAARLPVTRLVDRSDFERLLAAPVRWRSAHFAAHHVPVRPATAVAQAPGEAVAAELSTDPAPISPQPVEDFSTAWRYGVVVPKRHARRAVTRNLFRRLMRESFLERVAALPPGDWLLRLKAPFAARDFPSARSTALLQAARSELRALLAAT